MDTNELVRQLAVAISILLHVQLHIVFVSVYTLNITV
jgi:hypothetical protein